MTKGSAQDPTDSSLQMKIRQYLVTARRYPTEKDKTPAAFQMRVFAKNAVSAKTKFWSNMRRLRQFKRSQGEIIDVNEIFERGTNAVRTYGIVFRYQSRTCYVNMYKEFRDTSLNGAISQLHSVMSGNHRASPHSIQIVRTTILTKTDDIKRANVRVYRNSQIKFPIIKTIPRSSSKRFRTTFQGKRPNLWSA